VKLSLRMRLARRTYASGEPCFEGQSTTVIMNFPLLSGFSIQSLSTPEFRHFMSCRCCLFRVCISQGLRRSLFKFVLTGNVIPLSVLCYFHVSLLLPTLCLGLGLVKDTL
jgi:hypothetical protein